MPLRHLYMLHAYKHTPEFPAQILGYTIPALCTYTCTHNDGRAYLSIRWAAAARTYHLSTVRLDTVTPLMESSSALSCSSHPKDGRML